MHTSVESGAGQFVRHLLAIISAPLRRLKAALLAQSGHGKVRHLVMLESLELGNRRQLFLVACDDHRFLVGAGAERVGTLVALPDAVTDNAMRRAATPHAPRVWRPVRRAETEAGMGLRIVRRQGSLGGPVQHSAETGGSQWL